ncbi:hypothetical protein CDCA_CDCA01G0105 [Cyanidium caldarium]|uniref:Transcription initiation factor TFIID subunit 9 n=1 Tax=Cyanidium caldarium TaxID=2771 RepID=A0AAV9IP44_CYACA|nr:hypothetical protein CDCA_CDCA01G0105 [Cyanidium caldarium]
MTKYETASAPQDARSVAAILKAMQVEQYDERVVHVLLELLHRYMAQVLVDARDMAEHAARGAGASTARGGGGSLAAAAGGDAADIEVADLRLAIETRLQHEFTQAPPRELAMQQARALNAVPLPVIAGDRGTVQLPPPHHQLTARPYRVVARAPEALPQNVTKGLGSGSGSAEYSAMLAVADTVAERGAAAGEEDEDQEEAAGGPHKTRRVTAANESAAERMAVVEEVEERSTEHEAGDDGDSADDAKPHHPSRRTRQRH